MLALALRQRGLYMETLSDWYIENLYLAALLHDIGKIKISDIILCKPGRLADEEFETMKEHTVFGWAVLKETLSNIEEPEFIRVACDAPLEEVYTIMQEDAGKHFDPGIHKEIEKLG